MELRSVWVMESSSNAMASDSVEGSCLSFA